MTNTTPDAFEPIKCLVTIMSLVVEPNGNRLELVQGGGEIDPNYRVQLTMRDENRQERQIQFFGSRQYSEVKDCFNRHLKRYRKQHAC